MLLHYVLSGVSHDFVRCNLCGSTNALRGIDWICTVCYDFDLCHHCYMSNKHDLSHAFVRYDTPLSTTPLSVGYNRDRSIG